MEQDGTTPWHCSVSWRGTLPQLAVLHSLNLVLVPVLHVTEHGPQFDQNDGQLIG